MRNYLSECVKAVVMLGVLGCAAGCQRTAVVKTDNASRIKEAMEVMKTSAATLGEPRAVGESLFFGTTRMNDNYELVDSLKARFGCTATFFIKKDDRFIRISTNVMKGDRRAVGTELDSRGPAIAAIRKGEAYYGIADILGSPHETCYEPIKDAGGVIIGGYYVGYQTK